MSGKMLLTQNQYPKATACIGTDPNVGTLNRETNTQTLGAVKFMESPAETNAKSPRGTPKVGSSPEDDFTVYRRERTVMKVSRQNQ